MSLSASALASLIKSNLNGISDPSSANTILGNTITSYLLSNTVFTFSWTAIQTTPPVGPPPVPDPVTTATGEFIALSITITPSGATTAPAAQTALQDQIIEDMKNATCNITDSGFSTTPIALSSAPTIEDLVLSPSGSSDGDAAMLDLCTKIINWVKTLIPSSTTTGTRTAGAIIYTGTGTVTSIS